MISEVYNMDCMEYMKTIPDKFFDIAIVDPPYGINAPKQEERFKKFTEQGLLNFGEVK